MFRAICAAEDSLIYPQHPIKFVKLLASFLYAKVDELGYDENISYHKEDGKYCLIYQLGPQCFKTTELICEHLGACATGRSTRVFKATEVAARDNPVPKIGSVQKVLKHFWLEKSAKDEKAILEEVLNALGDKKKWKNMDFLEKRSELKNKLEKGTFKKYFLSIHASQTLAFSKPLPSTALPKCGLYASEAKVPMPAKMSFTPSSELQHDNTHNHERDSSWHRTYAPKKSLVIVYNEVCQALHDVPNLGTAAFAMADCFVGKC